ncbi:hypothetical protein FOZ60_002193 [Perkinsus olseni]|uniref:Uncharacterized protein n=1 Tax=Perkinsus olseni TaxID=32597 RepID=A0A7J6NYL0_PEROL|nr:hypothetical protein FOZ60_002193 [Perkinsus olseni]
MVRVSLSSGDCVEVIPVPPSTSSLRGKLIRTRLSPLGEHHEQSELGRTGSTDGVGWEAVAGIKLVVTGMDVIVRSDDEFQLVYVGRNADTDDFATYIHHIDYEGNENLEPYEDAWLCRFVPSNGELVCVAGGLDSFDVPWISLLGVWSMSVLFVLDRPGGIGKYNKFGESWYLAAMENCLVVVALSLRLRAFHEACHLSEGGLLWTIWSFIATPRPTLSHLYTAQRGGYISGMDSWGRSSVVFSVQPADGEDVRVISGHDVGDDYLKVVVDEFEVDRLPMSICTDGNMLYFSDADAERGCVARMSLPHGDRVVVFPSPPGQDSHYNLSETNCLSNGQLFMVGYGDHKLFRTVLPPVGDDVDRLVSDVDCPIDGVEWKPVADLPFDASYIDVIARCDSER